MEVLFRGLFAVLECPNLKIKKPAFIKQPSAFTMYVIVMISYFFVTAGIIYDIIIEPPSIGSTTDERGNSKPVAFMQYRVNGQYIMEGLAASFMFSIGGLGFVVLEHTNKSVMPRLNRILMFCVGFVSVIVAFLLSRVFMRMKLPGYLLE